VTIPAATSITITWTASADYERFEVTYSYTVNRCSATGGPVTANIDDGSVRSYTLNNLNEDSRYIITVRAFNSGGSSMATVMGNTMTAGEITPRKYGLWRIDLQQLGIKSCSLIDRKCYMKLELHCR
jgi:hypothetical protein